MSLELFEQMTQREKDKFSRICNMLLSVTYILRENSEGRLSAEFRFIDNNFELFSDYLAPSGWRIHKDSQYGIIYVENTEGYNKLSLNKLTTVMLITIRIIYEEGRTQVGSKTDICSTVSALFGKIINEFSIYPKKPSQKEIKDSFRILESHNLIRRLDESYNDFECRFVILPSVLIAVPNDKCKAICDNLKAESEDINDEEIDETAID